MHLELVTWLGSLYIYHAFESSFLFCIWNYLRSHFLCALWLAEKQPTTGPISMSVIPLHVCVFFKLTPFFSFWHQRCNTESWLLTKQAMSPCGAIYEESHPMRDSIHIGTQNSPSSSLWICTDQPPKLYVTERTVTKTKAIVKSAENTSFYNYSSFLYLFH